MRNKGEGEGEIGSCGKDVKPEKTVEKKKTGQEGKQMTMMRARSRPPRSLRSLRALTGTAPSFPGAQRPC